MLQKQKQHQKTEQYLEILKNVDAYIGVRQLVKKKFLGKVELAMLVMLLQHSDVMMTVPQIRAAIREQVDILNDIGGMHNVIRKMEKMQFVRMEIRKVEEREMYHWTITSKGRRILQLYIEMLALLLE